MTKNVIDIATKQKFMQYLARQGFSYDDIKKALENPKD